MDIIRKIEFNQELQWAKEMASPYVAAITNFIIREDNVKVESIAPPKPKGLSFEEYMKREDDIHCCHDLCLFFRQMGYIAYINDSEIDHYPASVTVYNLPLTPRVFAFCNMNRVLYLEYITPEKNRARIERWEDVVPITKTRIEHKWKFEHTYTRYMFEKFDLEDFGYLTMDLMHCTSYKHSTGLSVMCTINISSKIEKVLSSHFEEKDEAERLRLYAEALNDDNMLCPKRRSISDQINEAIDMEGLLDPEPNNDCPDKWENDKELNKITKSQDFIDYVISRAHICPQLYLDHRPDLGEHTLVLCHKFYGYDGTKSIDDYDVRPLTQLEKDKGLLQIVRDYFKTDGPYTKFADWDIIEEEKKEPVMRKFVKRTITQGKHEPWNEEDHCIIR